MVGKLFLLNIMPKRLSLQNEKNFNLEDWTEQKVIKKFRTSKFEINYICNLTKDLMQPVGYRSIDLSLKQKVRICLKTLGSGSFQKCSKDFIDVAQLTVIRVLSDFIETVHKLIQILFLCEETIILCRQ